MRRPGTSLSTTQRRRPAAGLLPAIVAVLTLGFAASAGADVAPERSMPPEPAAAPTTVEESAPGELISTQRVEPSEVDAAARRGEQRRARIRVNNPSRRTSLRVHVCDTLPRGVRFVRATPGFRNRGGRFCWATTLRPGASTTFWIVGRVATD